MRIHSTVRRTAMMMSAAALVAAAGCGGGSDDPTVTTSTPAAGKFASQDATIAAAVPAALRTKRTLIAGTDGAYAPNEFIDTDGRTIIGMDVDLITAVAEVMGLKVQMQKTSFDAIIPGLKGGRYDLGVSSFTDNKDREKIVDFVTYYKSGTAFFVNTAGGPDIKTLGDLCGHIVGLQKGTTQEADAKKQSTTCTMAGKPKVDVRSFPDQNAANLALKSKRVEVSMADSPIAAYQVKQSHGVFKLSGDLYGTAPYGFAIPKDNGLAQPMLDALKKLMADGVYLNILKKWGLEAGAITDPVINGALS
jgi:polar amino acid transport system substrate-binding protein